MSAEDNGTRNTLIADGDLMDGATQAINVIYNIKHKGIRCTDSESEKSGLLDVSTMRFLQELRGSIVFMIYRSI